MKEYKYKINGNDYKVAVGDIEGNVVQVEVNGTPYNVEIEEKEVKKKTSKRSKSKKIKESDILAQNIAQTVINENSEIIPQGVTLEIKEEIKNEIFSL